MPNFTVNLDQNHLSNIPHREGISRSAESLTFDGSRWTRKQAESLLTAFAPDGAKFTGQKAAKKAKAKILSPTVEDMAIIRRMLPDLGEDEQFTVFEISAANTRIDFEMDQLSKSVLDAMAAFVNANDGISFLFNHDNREILGKVFSARVELIAGESDHWELIEKVYIPQGVTMPGQPTISVDRAIRTGLLDKVSIRFLAPWELKELPDGGFITVFTDDGKTEILHTETSFVYFGGQRDAARRKSFDFKNEKRKPMQKTVQKQIELNGKSYGFSVAVDSEADSVALTAPEALAEDFTKMAGELKAATEKAEALQKELDEQKAPIVNKILNIQDEAKKDFKYSEDELKAMPLERLSAYLKDLSKEYDKGKSQVKPGAPANKTEEPTYF